MLRAQCGFSLLTSTFSAEPIRIRASKKISIKETSGLNDLRPLHSNSDDNASSDDDVGINFGQYERAVGMGGSWKAEKDESVTQNCNEKKDEGMPSSSVSRQDL